MFNSLRNKIIIPSISVLLILVLAIVIFVSVSTSNMATELIDDRMNAAASMVHTYIDSMTARVRVTASAESASQELTTALTNWNNNVDRDGNRLMLHQYFGERMNEIGLSGAVIFDRDGYIMLRTHDFGHYGDNLRHLPQASAALDRGETSTFFFSTPAQPMAQTAAVPIWHDGEVIGVLSASYFLHTNEFVDRLAQGFNAEVTIFAGPERVATTLRDPAGNREVGINAPDAVIESVIDRGVPFMDSIVLGGIDYSTYYFPLLNLAGAPAGMFFVGFSNESTNQAVAGVQRNLIIIGIAGLIVAAVVMLLLITNSLKPMGRLAKIVKDVSAGNVNVNIDKASITKDEIGALTHDISGLIDVIKNIVADLSNVHTQYIKVGDMHFQVDESKYQNSFKEMIGLVNNLAKTVTVDIESIIDMLKQVGNGNFNNKIDFDKWAGEWKIVPSALDELVTNIKSVSTEVNSMIVSVAEKGDLSFKIQADSYKGDWRGIMEGLNSIADAVNKPLQVMNLALIEMSNGNVDLADIERKIIAKGHRVEKELYSGIFYDCIVALKVSFTTMQSYVDEIAEKMLLMSQGDLSVSIGSEYLGSFASIKNSFNTISSTLRKAMGEISAASRYVLEGATKITSSAMDLADGSSTQAASLEELNTSVELIKMQTQEFAKNASEANTLSLKSSTNAKEGNTAMKEMVGAMMQIKESSGNISKIIKVIQDIAFQTNLLALNAAVEAARAGEHGRGFAVVAEEVRNLAARSQGAAGETTTLINDSITRVDSGAEIAGITSDSLDTIVAGTDEVLSLIHNITTAATDQADMIAQISQTLLHTANTVQDNSKFAHESAATAEELNSQSEMLQKLVSYFKV